MQHTPGELVFFLGFMLAAVGWRVWGTVTGRGQERGRTSERWSFFALFGMGALVFLGSLLEFFLVTRRYRWWVALVGVGLFVAAAVVRALAMRELGRYWSRHIEIRERQPLVCHGVYGWVRHPAYLASVMELVGVPLVGQAWWSLAAVAVLYVPLVYWRIALEEAALREKFGTNYVQYRRQVPRLFPVVWPRMREDHSVRE